MKKAIFLFLILMIFSACGGESMLDEKLYVPEDFKPVYKVVKIESFPHAGADRRSIKITLPKGLTGEQNNRWGQENIYPD